jgi:hydroxymethylpyrimidine/phosphomethylpyrimidine kinase
MEVFRAGLLPLADVATPNLAEAQSLSGIEVTSLEQMKAAADKIMMLGCASVLVTGGHLEGPEVFDVLCSEETLETMVAPRLHASHTHGTGCTLSTAIATFMAQGFDLREACYMAREFVREAMIHAPGFGQGNGPLNHQFASLIENPN